MACFHFFSNSSEPGCWNTSLYGPLQAPFHRFAEEHFDDSFALRLRKVLPVGEVLRIQNPEEGDQHILITLYLFYTCNLNLSIGLWVIVALLTLFQDPVVDQTTLDSKCQMLRKGWAMGPGAPWMLHGHGHGKTWGLRCCDIWWVRGGGHVMCFGASKDLARRLRKWVDCKPAAIWSRWIEFRVFHLDPGFTSFSSNRSILIWWQRSIIPKFSLAKGRNRKIFGLNLE